MDNAFIGIDHIGVAVADRDKACHTYSEVLGFSVSGEEVLDERGIAVTFVETGSARIELIAPTRADSEISKFLSTRGEGLHHVCVRVKDLDATLTQMLSRGALVIGNGPKPGAHGTRVAFVHPKGTHGVLLELSESPDASLAK